MKHVIQIAVSFCRTVTVIWELLDSIEMACLKEKPVVTELVMCSVARPGSARLMSSGRVRLWLETVSEQFRNNENWYCQNLKPFKSFRICLMYLLRLIYMFVTILRNTLCISRNAKALSPHNKQKYCNVLSY